MDARGVAGAVARAAGGHPVGRPTLRLTPPLRWTATALLAGLLAVAALVSPPASAPPTSTTPLELLRRVATSADTAHAGAVTSTGTLALPDLPRLTGVASLLGSTTRARVWWASAQTWRVDVLGATGEHGTYARDGRVSTWDAEADAVTTSAAPTGAHLPRALDLAPDALARDVLAGYGASPRVATALAELAGRRSGAAVTPSAAVRALLAGATVLGSSRVAGRPADGVRLPTRDARSTLAAADVWVDRASGLPVRVDLRSRSGVVALSTRFDDLHLGVPAASVLRAPDPPGAVHERAGDDLVADVDGFSPWQLPDALVGLPALVDPGAVDVTDTAPAATRPPGVVAYGEGLVRLALLPLPPDLARRSVSTARAAGAVDLGVDPPGSGTDGAQALWLRSGALSVAFVDASRGHAYVLAGPVTRDVLRAAARQLLDDPPPWRTR